MKASATAANTLLTAKRYIVPFNLDSLSSLHLGTLSGPEAYVPSQRTPPYVHTNERTVVQRLSESTDHQEYSAVGCGVGKMSSPKRRIETDVMKLMMSDYEVTLVNDNMQEFYVIFKGPTESRCILHCSRSLDAYSRVG